MEVPHTRRRRPGPGVGIRTAAPTPAGAGRAARDRGRASVRPKRPPVSYQRPECLTGLKSVGPRYSLDFACSRPTNPTRDTGQPCGPPVSLRRTKTSIIYKATGNLRAVQLLLGHTKIESTVRYLGVDVEDALTLAEHTEV